MSPDTDATAAPAERRDGPAVPTPDDDRERRSFLEIYLSDHLAGSVAGSNRAQRLADAERSGPDGPALRALADEIADDRLQLLALMDHLGVPPRRYKQVLAGLVERLGLIKLNGRFWRRSPLSTLVEIEGLLMGVRGKLAGWDTVRAALGADTVGPVDLDELCARARRQLATLADLHAAAAHRAL